MSQEQKIQKGRIQSRVDTVMGWAEKNPQLLDREIGYERETGKYKIGDGIKNWNELEYAKGADIDPDFVTNVLSELENKSNKDHTHELAEYAELVPINLSEITILDSSASNNDGTIEGNSLWGANGTYIINYQGYVEFIASYSGSGPEDGTGYTSSAYISIDNDYTNSFSWENRDDTKFIYKGVVNNNITIYTGWSGISFEVFNGITNGSVSKNGFMSIEDKKKIDNTYTKEEVDNLLIEKASAINQLSEEKADKEFVVSIFEQLKALIEAGKTDEVIAVLDEAIFDLAVLA